MTLVTVEVESGQVYVGFITLLDPATLKLTTGYRGHPRLIPTAQIVEILPVNQRNPHVER